MFEQTFLETAGHTSRPLAVTASFLAQLTLIGGGIVLPLVYTNALPQQARFTRIGAPMAPPKGNTLKPVAQSQQRGSAQAARPFVITGIVQPSSIPQHIAAVVDNIAPPGAGTGRIGVPWGVEGADDSGRMAWLNSNMAQGIQIAPPPTPAPVKTAAKTEAHVSQPVRQGGDVQSAKLIQRVLPVYPALAKQARITGVVRLEAIITKEGRIRELHLASGHPLLAPAAMEAVRQWLYQPTLLNGEPVEVITEIDVNFTLVP